MSAADDEVTPLAVHVRRVVAADGEMHSENEVYCVPRGHSVAISECEACADNAGADIDLEHHRNFVLCRRLTLETARGTVTARPPVLRRRFVSEATAGERTPVSEIMTADVWCARDDLDLESLRKTLLQHHFTGVPVVDTLGRCVGVVSMADLVRAGNGAERVRDVMQRLTFVLPDNASISQAAALMALEHVHRIPIVTDDGKVAGIVSSIDVLGWLGRQDGYVVPR
ncbi:MAG: CBS domain-containing protein [Polyangia bacterium]